MLTLVAVLLFTEQTNVRSQPNGNIITKLQNGAGVLVTEQKRATNVLWDYVMLDTGEARARYHSMGWVLDGVLRCPVEKVQTRLDTRSTA
jgi:hypothetical protein